MNKQEYKLHQKVKIWNILATLFFIILCLFMYEFHKQLVGTNFSFNLWDICILAFANYRLIRLFVYDNITLFLREIFMDLQIENGKYVYENSKNSFKLTIHKLLNCPWCFGVWTGFVSAFFYFTFPTLQIVFIVLAFSSVSSFMVLVSNLVGWSAEEKKLNVQGK